MRSEWVESEPGVQKTVEIGATVTFLPPLYGRTDRQTDNIDISVVSTVLGSRGRQHNSSTSTAPQMTGETPCNFFTNLTSDAIH